MGEVRRAQTSGATLGSCSFNKLLAGGLRALRQLSEVAYSLGTTGADSGTVTQVSALPVPARPDRLESPSSPWCRQSHALQHHPADVGGAQAVPRGGLRRNEVRVSFPPCSALALRSKLLGTPRFQPPGSSCFSCATPSSALALGHPPDRKRLFQPQKPQVSSPAVPAVRPPARWVGGESKEGVGSASGEMGWGTTPGWFGGSSCPPYSAFVQILLSRVLGAPHTPPPRPRCLKVQLSIPLDALPMAHPLCLCFQSEYLSYFL